MTPESPKREPPSQLLPCPECGGEGWFSREEYALVEASPCFDCGRAVLDAHVSGETWAAISDEVSNEDRKPRQPSKQGGGLLCASCIVRRIRKRMPYPESLVTILTHSEIDSLRSRLRTQRERLEKVRMEFADWTPGRGQQTYDIERQAKKMREYLLAALDTILKEEG